MRVHFTPGVWFPSNRRHATEHLLGGEVHHGRTGYSSVCKCSINMLVILLIYVLLWMLRMNSVIARKFIFIYVRNARDKFADLCQSSLLLPISDPDGDPNNTRNQLFLVSLLSSSENFIKVCGYSLSNVECYWSPQATNRVVQKTNKHCFFFQVYWSSFNLQQSMHGRPHRCSTNFWAAAVTLASGQRTSIVSSYQNDASPQPRTTASHCSLDNVSNEKK